MVPTVGPSKQCDSFPVCLQPSPDLACPSLGRGSRRRLLHPPSMQPADSLILATPSCHFHFTTNALALHIPSPQRTQRLPQSHPHIPTPDPRPHAGSPTSPSIQFIPLVSFHYHSTDFVLAKATAGLPMVMLKDAPLSLSCLTLTLGHSHLHPLFPARGHWPAFPSTSLTPFSFAFSIGPHLPLKRICSQPPSLSSTAPMASAPPRH